MSTNARRIPTTVVPFRYAVTYVDSSSPALETTDAELAAAYVDAHTHASDWASFRGAWAVPGDYAASVVAAAEAEGSVRLSLAQGMGATLEAWQLPRTQGEADALAAWELAQLPADVTLTDANGREYVSVPRLAPEPTPRELAERAELEARNAADDARTLELARRFPVGSRVALVRNGDRGTVASVVSGVVALELDPDAGSPMGRRYAYAPDALTTELGRHPYALGMATLAVAPVSSRALELIAAILVDAAAEDGRLSGELDARTGQHDDAPLSGEWADGRTPWSLFAETAGTVAEDTVGYLGLAHSAIGAIRSQLLELAETVYGYASLVDLVADAWASSYADAAPADDDDADDAPTVDDAPRGTGPRSAASSRYAELLGSPFPLGRL
jgi:hypothetical protein